MITRKMVSVEIPGPMLDGIKEICTYWHISRSDVIRMALDMYLYDFKDKMTRRPDEEQFRIEEVFEDGNP